MIELGKLGNLSQIAYIKEVCVRGGISSGLEQLLVKNQGLYLSVETGRAFDIGEMSFNGINLAYISKNGAVSPFVAYTGAHGYMNSFSGGFLFTCGLDNIGNPTEKSVQHGRIGASPASIIRKEVIIENGITVAILEGEVSQTALFGENLVLRRCYKIYPDKLIVSDEVLNKGFKPQDIYLLYHFNIGYPLLDEKTEIISNSVSIIGRDEKSKKNEKTAGVFSAPDKDYAEENFIHSFSEPKTQIDIINKKLGLKLSFNYKNEILKYFLQWKNALSGDYALGIEPSTSRFAPNITPIALKAGESIKTEVEIKIIKI
ncbi:MAG: aldose 1-epimerase family protein [Firmicutes bacterium]|nr:aldose 1-epimerase family protein [Bacillota bacterium]